MGKFGFETDAGSTSQAQEGYAKARVHLGQHSETVRFWLKPWSLADYVQHWHDAAQDLLRGKRAVLFCTDYSPDNFSCFVGWPEGNGFVFEEWVVKHECVTLKGHRLVYVGADAGPSAKAAHFHVPQDDLEAFLRSR